MLNEIIEIKNIHLRNQDLDEVTYGKNSNPLYSKSEKSKNNDYSIISNIEDKNTNYQLIQEEIGEKFTETYSIYFYVKNITTNEKIKISPWHDIPLYVNESLRTVPECFNINRYNFICEIPKWTRAKFEISVKNDFNPIKQDIKNEKPRFYKHGDMMWNYGAFPKTLESLNHISYNDYYGDGDPLDCIEIGMKQLKTGEVWPVKILGVLGLIDENQMDWKIIAITHADPISKFLHDIYDVPKYLPGCLDAIREWFRVYKICQGGEENKFAFNGEYQNKQYAISIVENTHNNWKQLFN